MEHPMSRPPWSRDEVVLALDLYLRNDRRVLNKTHPDVIELSRLLNAMPINIDKRTEKYRNTAGISLKLANLRSLDPKHESVGLKGASAMDREVWDEFADDPEILAREARRIRRFVNEV
jgi:5-methylcytosine-specific restriction protein A